jgi:prepilin-type N-terminal cleavage/methylation domain-containing protein
MMKFRPQHFHPQSAFTMVEVAISLAIIGIALLGIVGVLPLGLNAQRNSREKTIINQDATVFIEAIRNGSRGADDLTNYVYAIVITNAANQNVYINSSLAGAMNFSTASFPAAPPIQSYPILTNGANIIGLLGTPEYVDSSGKPVGEPFGGNYITNHVIAYVRSISGPAVEKPPQNNQILQQGSFGYRIFCVNAPVASDTNAASANSPYVRQLAANLHELRLTFEWPQLPNGKLGSGRQTYRAKVGGQVTQDATNNSLYFYQQQSFTSAP